MKNYLNKIKNSLNEIKNKEDLIIKILFIIIIILLLYKIFQNQKENFTTIKKSQVIYHNPQHQDMSQLPIIPQHQTVPTQPVMTHPQHQAMVYSIMHK